MPDISTFLFAFFGGLLPAVIWLLFWLREDDAHPEPNGYIILTFFFGMLAVPITLAVQLAVNHFLLGDIAIDEAIMTVPLVGMITIIIWAITEEILKYQAAKQAALKKRVNDEPMDDMIYLITAALGFAALENALYLFGPILDGHTELAIATGNMRFIGATLLHVAAAAIIGAFRAFSHFKLKEVRKRYVWTGIILAITLHALFNLFIMKYTESIFIAFSVVWIIIIAIIFTFERIKNIHLEKIQK